MQRKVQLQLFNFVILMFVLTAIGFSVPDNSRLNGAYIVTGYHAVADGNKTAERLQFTFDGSGSGTLQLLEDSDGTATYTVDINYNVQANGFMDITLQANSDTIFLGMIKPDNQVFSLSMPGDTSGYIGLGIKKWTGGNNSAMSGQYVYMSYAYNENGGHQLTGMGQLWFDGIDSISVEDWVISDPSTGLDPNSYNVNYRVENDGTLWLDDSSAVGIVNEDGDIFCTYYNSEEDGEFGFFLAVKRSSSRIWDDFQGRWMYSQVRGEGGFNSEGEESQSGIYYELEFPDDSTAIFFAQNGEATVPPDTMKGEVSTYLNDFGYFIMGSDSGHQGMLSPDGDFIAEVDFSRNVSVAIGFWVRHTSPQTSIFADDSQVPKTAELGKNYPNPFNPSTQIPFRLERSGDVSIRIYDSTGRLIKELVSGRKNAGAHLASWDGKSLTGQNVASGIYFYTLKYNGSLFGTGQMVLVK